METNLLNAGQDNSPKLSIVIVSWNSRTIIGRCIELVQASALPFDAQVIVFDNNSSDGTVDYVGEFDDVVTIKSPENLGFGKANNEAARAIHSEYVLFLNPDAYLENPEAVAELACVLDDNPDVCGVAPRLLNLDGTHQVGDAGYSPTLWHVAAHQFFLSRMFPFAKGYYVSHKGLRAKGKVRVDWLAGTCLMMRREDFLQLGGFDSKIFMYGEDVDLGCRLTRSGRTLLYVPSVEVTHLQGATQKNANEHYVSVKWIDSLFAIDRGKFEVNALKWVLAGGFLLRAGVYGLLSYVRGRPLDKARSNAMAKYYRHVLEIR